MSYIQLYFTSDLDVVIRLDDVDHQDDKKRTLFQLSAALKASGVTRQARVNHYARVPVVTFQSEPNFGPSFLISVDTSWIYSLWTPVGSLNFDLGVNNTDGFAAVEIVNS